MKTVSKFIYSALFILISLNIHAQRVTVTGKVMDSDGEEVIGANVVLKNNPAIGTITDLEGNYSIPINDAAKDILVFTFVGMQDQEVAVNGKSRIDVTMKSNAYLLDEVVAIGYATTKRKDLTGAVSSVQGSEIGKIPVSNVGQALAGKIAGVWVTQAEGSPDAEVSIRVRGGTSITQSNEPLYIIDGFVNDNGLKGLDPSDIESIDVLKDASSTAIYGSAGANGVVLITTKTAKEGKPTINYDMYVGFKKLTKRVDLLSVSEFVQLEYERAMIGDEDEKRNYLRLYADPYSADQGSVLEALQNSYADIIPTYADRQGINWQDEVFDGNSPISQNHKVSVSGGKKGATYNISYARTNDDGIMKNSGLTRNNIRARFNQEVNKKIRFGVNMNYIDETTEGMGSLSESGQFSRMQHILQYRPIISKYGDDKDLLVFQVDPAIEEDSGNQMQNPLISLEAEERTRRNKSLALNGEVTIKLNNYFTYRGTVGMRNRTMEDRLFYHSESRQAINAGAPWGTIRKNEYETLQYNNTLTYKPKLKKGHSFDMMFGQEDYSLETRTLSITNTNFPEDNLGLEDISLGKTPDIPASGHIKYRKISFFTRANYNYKSKYLATFTLRADGSNRFGKNEKWGYFPAASFAWRASDEEFINNWGVFSNLKFRFGYGMAGNDGISNYRSLAIMSSGDTPFGNALYPSYGSSQLPNPNVKWETNVTANLGVEMGFIDQRIQLVVDLYNNNTKDLLLETRVPYLAGYGTTMKNMGKTRNRGVEVTINTLNVNTKDFMWETSLNLAHNKNEVVSLARQSGLFTSRVGWIGTSEFNDDEYITKEKHAVGSMFGYKLEGIYTVDDFDYDPASKKYILKEGIPYDEANEPKPGSWKFADTDGDGKITEEDKTLIGNANPDLVGGFINNFSYKGFDLSIGFNFQIGGNVFNANRMYFTKMNNKKRNSLAAAADRFTYIDPTTGANVFNDPERLAIANEGKTMASIEGSSVLKFHSGYVENASFLRLNNVTFGYTFPKRLLNKAAISNLRLYASAYNLLTITGYSGFDPEVNVKPNGGLTPGVDWGAYPRSLSFVFGLNLSF